MSLMKSDRTKAPKSDRIAGYAITPSPLWYSGQYQDLVRYLRGCFVLSPARAVMSMIP